MYSTALQELMVCLIIITSYMKRCVFRFDLKMSKDGDFLISNGLGAAQANARSPSVSFLFYVMGSAVIEYLGNCAGCECVGAI